MAFKQRIVNLKNVFKKPWSGVELGQWLLLAGVVIALAVSLYFFTRDVVLLGKEGVLRMPKRGDYLSRNFFRIHHSPIQSSEIQSWMTFAYVDHVFNLPPDYLAEHLNIVNKKYPNITLADQAKISHTDTIDFVKKIQNIVNDFSSGQHLVAPGGGQ